MFAEDMFLKLLLQAKINLMEADVRMFLYSFVFVSDNFLLPEQIKLFENLEEIFTDLNL